MDRKKQIASLTGRIPVRVRAAVYDAGASTRRTLGWRPPTTYPNQVLNVLTRLRDRSRDAVRNDGYAKGVIDKLVSNIVGTGIRPLSQADDSDFRKEAEALFKRWTDDSDADGLLDWYGQEAQAVRCWLEAGEVFLRFRNRRKSDGLLVPLQIQVLEPELCPHNYTTVRGRNRVRAGIEFDLIGRRVAYYFYASRPGDYADIDKSQLRRIPAGQVIHLYKPLRAGQLRGTPHLTQALVRLHELDQFDDATLVRQKLATMFVAFLKNMSGDSDVQPFTSEAVTDTVGDRPVLGFEPGAFQELEPGQEVQFSKPPGTPDGYDDYMCRQLYAVAAATGVPYEVLTGDMNRVNDRTVRVVLHEFRRQIQADQHQTVAFQLCRPVWAVWMARALESGALFRDVWPADYFRDPEPWQRVIWSPQGWPYLHPVQDVQASKEAVRTGLASRSSVVSELGEDAAVIDEQQARDNARADGLGLKYDSDGRSGKGGSKPGGDGQFGEAPLPNPNKVNPDPDDPKE